MKLWKRNAVVGAVVLFVCAAVYLNWSCQEEAADSGKVLGEATLVDGRTEDPLLTGTDPAAEAETGAAVTEPDAETADVSVEEHGPVIRTGYFDTARLNRETARDSALAMLQDTLSSETAEETAKTEAGDAIETLAASTVSEAQIENLVIAKGYQDCITFISDGGVSVVVSSTGTGIQDTDVAKITEIVTEETGIAPAQVKIIEAEP